MTLSIVDNLGCTADTSYDVTVNERPTVFAGGMITVCPSDSAQLNAIAANGNPPYSYQWSPSAGLNSDTIFDPYTFNTNGITYVVTVTDSNGCSSLPDSVTVNQFTPPTISASSINLCTTQTPLQNTFTVLGAGPGSTFEWGLSPSYSFITNAAADSSDITADFPPAVATYDFTAVITDGVTGCIDTVSTSFSVTAGLTMSVSGPSLICTGDSATLIVSGATTYSWTSSPVYVLGDSTASTQTVSPPSNTVFTIIGTTGTCTETITDSLTVSPKPDVFVNPIPPFCGCATVVLNGAGSTSNMLYLWTSLVGSSIVSSSSLVTNATICGNDTITLLVTDSISGCFNDSTVVTTLLPKPTAMISVSPNLICNGVSTLITLYSNGR